MLNEHAIIKQENVYFLKVLECLGKFEMEKIELSPAEVMSALNWNKSKVYYWISSKKFETVERIDGLKVVLTQADIQRLKKSDGSKNFESSNASENVSNNSEKVQENFDTNVTKNYENVSNNFNQNNVKLFNDTLELVKQMHQSSLMNYNYTVKMLSDGQSALEKEHLELKAEYKSVQEKLKVSEKEHQESLKKSETEYQEKIKKAESKNNIKNNIYVEKQGEDCVLAAQGVRCCHSWCFGTCLGVIKI